MRLSSAWVFAVAGKRTGAAAMLAAGRRTAANTGTSNHDDQSSRSPVSESPGDQVASSPSTPSDSSPSTPSDSSPSTHSDSSPSTQATSALASYQRTAVYLTPELRRWLRDTARSLPDGLSASDVIRFALTRLRYDTEGERVELVPELVDQAHQEAERYAGRRNRGLPLRD